MKDEYEGHGGSYLIDPVSGARKLVERTRDPLDTSSVAVGAAGSVATAPVSTTAPSTEG